VIKYIRLPLGLLIFGVVVWFTDWSRVVDCFAQMNWILWMAAVAVYLSIQVVSSVRWRLISRPLGFDGPLRQFVGLYFVGMFFNMVLPTSVGGDVVRAWYLAKTRRTSTTSAGVAAFASVFLERLTGLMVLLSLASFAVCFCPAEVSSWLPWMVWGMTATAVVGLGVLIALPKAPSLLSRFANLQAKLNKLSEQLTTAIGLVLSTPSLLPRVALLSLIVQSGNVAVVWLIGTGLGLDVPASYYWVLVPVVSLVTMVPLTVNGLGVREGTTVLLLAPLSVAGGSAVSLAFLWFLVQATASLGGLVPYLMLKTSPSETEAEHGSVGDHSDQGREGQSSAAA
jgi:hypothetical protein